MFEAYSVAVTLRMNNLVSPELAGMAREFSALQKEAAALNALFKSMEKSAASFGRAAKSADGAAASVRSTGKAAKEAASDFAQATAAAAAYKSELVAIRAASIAPMRNGSLAAERALAQYSAPTGIGFGGSGTAIAAIAAMHAQANQRAALGGMPYTAFRMRTPPEALMALTGGGGGSITIGPGGVLGFQAGNAGGIPPNLTSPRLALPGGMPYTPFTMRSPGAGGAGGQGGGVTPPGGGGGGGGGPRPGAVPPAGAGGQGGGRGGFHGGNVHLGPNGIGIGTVGMSAGSGMLPLIGAAGSIYGAKALYESARDYETAAARFKTLNLGDAVNKEAEKFARGTKVFGVSSANLMETLRESVGMFGSMPNALQVAPVLSQLNAANSNLFGGKIGKIDDHAVRALMRFNDMRGLTDSPKDFMRGLDLAQRMVTGSGGSLDFAGLEQLAKRGGAAFKGLNDDGVMMLSTLAQEQGGATTGTALMSLYQNLIAGRTTKKAMAALMDAELVTLGTVNTGTVGGKKSNSTVITGVKEEKLLRENPGMWLMTVGLDAAKKTGAKTDSEIISVVNSWLSNRTGSNMAANFTTQSLQAMRDFKLAKNAAGVDQTIALNQKSASGKEGEFIAAWSNFKTEFGTSALPAFTSLLTSGAGFLRSINGFMTSPSTKSFIAAYEGGFKAQGNFIGKTVDTLFGAKPGAQEVRTGAAVAGNDTAGGAFTGFRSPIRTSNAGGGRGMINNTIVMPNGRELARVVTQEQGKELNRPQTGPRTVDGRQSLRAFDTERGG